MRAPKYKHRSKHKNETLLTFIYLAFTFISGDCRIVLQVFVLLFLLLCVLFEDDRVNVITNRLKQWKCGLHWIMSPLILCFCIDCHQVTATLTNSMFLEEFPKLLSQYADSRRDVVHLGDFNFHYDDSSDGQVSRLKTLRRDHISYSARQRSHPQVRPYPGLGCSSHREHLSVF